MMNQLPMKALAIVAAVSAVLSLGACASTSPQQDAHFGDAAKRLYQLQRLNPDASRANEGMTFSADGRTVRAGMERMAESYRSPQANVDQTLGTIGNTSPTGR